MTRDKIKNIVKRILDENNLRTFPVDVKKIADLAGAHVETAKLKDGLSGFAFQQNGTKLIGISEDDGALRQRFTIAHELGHLYLHKDSAVSYDQGLMMMRDSHSSDGTDTREIEANRFAAELLMPEDEVRRDMASHKGIDFLDENSETREFIKTLSDKYKVSHKAMSVRLATLYFN